MDFFKIKDLRDYPLDEIDYPLDGELEDPLAKIRAEFDLNDQFSISDEDFDDIDNISPIIDKNMQDNFEEPEDEQFQDELNDDPLNDETLDNPEEINDLDDNLDAGEEEPENQEDPNFQGIIRTVKGANLVYKRKNTTDSFDELWVMNIGNDMKKESLTKRAILAGTDVDSVSGQSPDGKQEMELWSCGNIQFISLTNIPS